MRTFLRIRPGIISILLMVLLFVLQQVFWVKLLTLPEMEVFVSSSLSSARFVALPETDPLPSAQFR